MDFKAEYCMIPFLPRPATLFQTTSAFVSVLSQHFWGPKSNLDEKHCQKIWETIVITSQNKQKIY